MMSGWRGLASAVVALVACSAVTDALADGTVKVGVVNSFSGPFADFGEQIGNGMAVYMRQHGDTVAGKKIEIINRDAGGPNPDKAKQLVQDLIIRDKVDFIAGLDFTPNALAVAPLLTEAKKPAVLMLTATQIVTEKSPYFTRFSFSIDMQQQKLGEWAAKNGMKNAYILVSDYVSGNAAADSFTKGFVGGGGTIAGRVGVPLSGADLAPLCNALPMRSRALSMSSS